MKKLKFLLKFIGYYFNSSNAHGIQSPFVFNLYNQAINSKSAFYAFDKIELLRKRLLLSKRKIEVTDLGSGKSGKRMIFDIAEGSAKNAKYGQLLFRLVNYFKPEYIVELGTSLGISTAYLAMANSKTKVITIEGCANTAKVAQENFDRLQLKNIESHIGNFDEVLPLILPTLPSEGCTLFFIDGNHRKGPTLNYFKLCLSKVNNNSIIIFDDINWSDEMRRAWQEIIQHNKVSISINLFFLGIVFFHQNQAKEDFVLRF